MTRQRFTWDSIESHEIGLVGLPEFLRQTFLITALALPLGAQQPATEETVVAAAEFFEKRVRPLLVNHCYECHSAAADTPKGGLRLDSRAALLRGGESGPAIVPGNADASELILAVRYDAEGCQMLQVRRPQFSGFTFRHLVGFLVTASSQTFVA